MLFFPEILKFVEGRALKNLFTKLRKTLGHQSSSVNNFYYKRLFEYIATKVIMATDTAKVLEAGCTCLNTRAGDLLTVKLKYNTPAAGGAIAATRVANLMHIVLHSDHILEIHDTGVRVFD